MTRDKDIGGFIFILDCFVVWIISLGLFVCVASAAGTQVQ